ncbi:MAG TPA: histidine kinase [Cyclobacteriaceae bacterium]|nr:histidine kinase [Cyclobacteriaceae bacterium]
MSFANRFKSPYIKFAFWWAFWTLVGTILVRQFQYSWAVSFADAAVTQLDWTVAGYVLNSMLRYYRPSSRNILNLLVFSLALAGLFTFLVLPYFLPKAVAYIGGPADYSSFLDGSLFVRFVMSWMQLLFVAAISWMWYFIEEQQQNLKMKGDTERLAREAELSQLRQQLQPHFLFNSLNSINALVVAQPELARKMIQQLSDFLRGTIKKDDRQLVTLEEDIHQLSLYLDIEKVRFGYRLRSEIRSDEESNACKLPPLLLQPIVENAIKYGLYDTIGEITISIEASVEDKHLVIRVSNPFDPATSQPKGTGFGLNSIGRRLYLIYFNNNLLQTSAEDSIFTTTIKIPQI